jgi:iron uptake system component EfeO
MFVTWKSTAILVLAAPALLLAACSSSSEVGSASTAASTIAVTASDTECILSSATVPAGALEFTVTNTGSQVTEVYVYGKSGEAFTTVVAEVENIGPGVERDMSAELAPGTYEVACKPGQTGDGIRASLTVTGNASQNPAASTAALRAIELGITDADALTGLKGQSAKVGDRIEFEVTNSAAAERVFEVKRPDGSVAGEIQIESGKTGDLTLDLAAAGNWSLIVEGGPTVTTADFPVS